MKQLNLAAGLGVVVSSPPIRGPGGLCVVCKPLRSVQIEAKKDSAGENITVTENQTERYATANLKWRKIPRPLRLFQATGQIIRFTDSADPVPRSRDIPLLQTGNLNLAGSAETLRHRLAEQMPALPERNLRDCQISAVTGLKPH